MSEYRHEFLKGYADQRFPSKPPDEAKFSIVGSLLSIASLISMSAIAIYMVRLLNQPSVAFHLIKDNGPTCKTDDQGYPSFMCYIENVVCFFPNILYTENTSVEFFQYCKKDVLSKPSDGKQDGALWTLLPFYFTIYGSTLGWVFESVMLLMGHPFDKSFNRFTTFISRLRELNGGPVVATLFFFATALMVPSKDVPFLKTLMYISIFMVVALSIGLFWGGYRVLGGTDMLPLVMMGIQVTEFFFVVRVRLFW